MQANGSLYSSSALLAGKDPSTHWIGGWMGLGVGVEAVEAIMIRNKITDVYSENNSTRINNICGQNSEIF
jgi:hypothetical protein